MKQVADDLVSLTVTSPPYWNSIDYDVHAGGSRSWYRSRGYAEGFDDYGGYLDLMQRIFGDVLRATKPGGFCSVVIGTVLMNGAPHPGAVRFCGADGTGRLAFPPRHSVA